MQTYKEYLCTMKSYNFIPLNKKMWRSWQIYHHGYYRDENVDIYTAMSNAKIEISNWCSDMYVKVTERSTEILNREEFRLNKINSTKFIDEIKRELYYDIPFAYQKYHDNG